MAKHQHQDVNTASAVRIGIYQPTRRPVAGTWNVETAWGSATITGRLGQRHLDFLECARDIAEAQGVDGAGRYCCIVDPNKLRTAMSAGRSRVEWSQMMRLADDLRTCAISDLRLTDRPGFGVVTSGIIDAVVYEGVGLVPARAGARLAAKAARGVEMRNLWKIPLSEAWTALMRVDLPISYRGQLRHIVSLRHGVSQAVARFLLSHERGARYGLDKVLLTVGADKHLLHHRRREIQDDADRLAVAGIVVTSDEISTAGAKLNPGGAKLNPGGAKLNPGGAKLNPGSYRLIGQ